jgi:endonuclease I
MTSETDCFLITLFEWHEQDPVSTFERNHNDIIFKDYQGNRNPFIDHPE